MSSPKLPLSAPIVPMDFLHGVKVVDIGDMRVTRGLARRTPSACKHLSLVFDQHERRIWCKDCETNVEAFDAFTRLVERFDALDKRIESLRALEAETLRSRAAKVLDKIFRKRDATPCCPHCSRGILAEDVLAGVRSTSRELELKRRGKK